MAVGRLPSRQIAKPFFHFHTAFEVCMHPFGGSSSFCVQFTSSSSCENICKALIPHTHTHTRRNKAAVLMHQAHKRALQGRRSIASSSVVCLVRGKVGWYFCWMRAKYLCVLACIHDLSMRTSSPSHCSVPDTCEIVRFGSILATSGASENVLLKFLGRFCDF